jgi:hypothetical protein
MCSTLWWILYIWEAICWNFSHFTLIHALSTKGRSLCMVWGHVEHLEGVPIDPDSFWKVWCMSGLMGRSNRPLAVRWQVSGLTARCRQSNRPGQSEQDFALCCIPVVHCCIGSGAACICAGELFVLFELWIGSLCSLLEHGFVSDVSSGCPYLRGPRLIFFKWFCSLPFFGFQSLVGVSFYSFLFFFSLVLLYVCVVNALSKGEIVNHVWFEDQWMVASCCDEWLTTLCGLTLG